MARPDEGVSMSLESMETTVKYTERQLVENIERMMRDLSTNEKSVVANYLIGYLSTWAAQ